MKLGLTDTVSVTNILAGRIRSVAGNFVKTILVDTEDGLKVLEADAVEAFEKLYQAGEAEAPTLLAAAIQAALAAAKL